MKSEAEPPPQPPAPPSKQSMYLRFDLRRYVLVLSVTTDAQLNAIINHLMTLIWAFSQYHKVTNDSVVAFCLLLLFACPFVDVCFHTQSVVGPVVVYVSDIKSTKISSQCNLAGKVCLKYIMYLRRRWYEKPMLPAAADCERSFQSLKFCVNLYDGMGRRNETTIIAYLGEMKSNTSWKKC